MVIYVWVYSYIFQHQFSHTTYRDGKNSGAHIERPGCVCLVCIVPIKDEVIKMYPSFQCQGNLTYSTINEIIIMNKQLGKEGGGHSFVCK